MTVEAPNMTKPPRRPLHVLGFAALFLVLLFPTLWAAAALYFDVRVPWLRAPLAVAYLVLILVVCVFARSWKAKIGLTMVSFLVVLAWWLMLRPSNDRDWQPD